MPSSVKKLGEESEGQNLHPSLILFQVIFLLLVAGTLTLLRVDQGVTPPPVGDNPTPLGYTWSLLLFILPFLWLVVWLFHHPAIHIPRRTFLMTVGLLIPVGFVLDLLFAHTFFTFGNTGAVLGIEIPGRGGGVPIEEFVFYTMGFLFVLLLYIWSDEVWMSRYNLPHTHDDFKNVDRLLKFHWQSAIVAVVILAAAVVYKKFFSDDPGGFPGYLTYLLAMSFIPSAGFYGSVKRFVNWRAFSFAFLLVLLISLMWEASLASPYEWWNYQAGQMTGIFITAWNSLPVEAVFVWLAVTYTTVIVYEVITIWQASGKSFKEAFFGSGG